MSSPTDAAATYVHVGVVVALTTAPSKVTLDVYVALKFERRLTSFPVSVWQITVGT